MKLLCMICLVHVSFQLKCDKSQVTAHVGGEFVIYCSYNTNGFLFSKKYWCRGSSHHSCEIVTDSETKSTQRSTVLDAGRRGLFIKVTALRFEDAGVYWVGIDKVYADVMTSVELVVTEVPVSKPTLWPLSPLVERPSCWGKDVTVRCSSNRGTNVAYVWYQQTPPEAALVSKSSDLRLHCGLAQTDTSFYCVAKNDMGQQQSDPVFVLVLMPAENNCIYAVKMQGQLVYDCTDRLTTTATATTAQSTAASSTSVSDSSPPASPVSQNQTHQSGIHSWSWTTIPLWYRFLRLSLFLSMLMILLLVVRFTKRSHRESHVRRRRKT